MIDQKTPSLLLPLPHPGNALQDDVLRIRSAFTMLDGKIAALDAILTSDDINLDTVQELVAAIKSAQSEIGIINTLIADQIAALNASVNIQLANQNSNVGAQLATITALVYAGL